MSSKLNKIIGSILLITLLTSCTIGNGINVQEEEVQEIVLDEKREIPLKVMYFSEEVESDRLKSAYLDGFEEKHPQVKIEFIRHNLYQGASIEEDEKALRELIKNEQPDVIQ